MSKTFMTRGRIALLLLMLATLFVTACSPEAKKQKALEGGNKYFEKGQYKQARLMYLNAIKVDPRFGEAYYKLALTNLRLGSYGEAVGNLQRCIETQPSNLDAHSKLADLYLSAYSANPAKSKNLLVEIKELATRLEKNGRGSYEQLRLKGFLAVNDNKPEEALALFREADKKKPGQPVLQMTIARTLLVLKRDDEALSYLHDLVAKDKAFGSAFDLLYGVAMAKGKPDEAEKVLLQRAEGAPGDTPNRLRLAAHYYSTRQTEKMSAILTETLAQRDKYSNAFTQIGDFYYRIGDFDRAASTYLEGVKQEPAQSRAYRKRLIEVRVAQNRAPEALEICEGILKEDKNDSEAIAMRASLWLYAGKPEQINTAISELQSVITKMPDNFVLRYNLGRALLAKGDLDGARVQFVDALRARPNYIPARLALAQVLIARREFAAALSAANEILQIDPTNQYARLIQSQTYLAQEKFSDARLVLEQALKDNPNQRDAKYQLGYSLFKEGKLKEAEALFQEIYRREPPDLRGLTGLTEIYSAQKQTDKALGLLDQAIQKYPKANGLQVVWANVAIRGGRIDDGLKRYREILAADPKNYDVHIRLADALRLKGDLAQAIEMWKKASELQPTLTLPVLSRAMALDAVSRRSESAPLYEQVLKAEPDNVIALNNYSYYLADQGSNLDLALSYAQKAKSKAPSDPSVADTLGFIYLKKNLPQNATAIFTELAGKYPDVALFHIRLATAYLQAGDRAKAKQQLDDARRKKPSKSDLEEISKLASKLG